MNTSLVKTPIAIIGMACRLPGADGLEGYWRLLSSGTDAVGEMPPEKLDRALYYHPEKGQRGRTYSTRGGLISARPLDRARTPISDDDLRRSDPCHQILCETAAEAVRHAGLDPFHMPAWKVGVYVGHSGGSPLGGDTSLAAAAAESIDFLRDAPEFAALPSDVREQVVRETVARLRERRPYRDIAGAPENGANAVAGLIASAMKLSGPQMAVDAACASSLVALSLGISALQQGTIDAAIVGGASYNKCDSLILFSHAQSCSASASRPFDEDADGLISSEGYVALVIKTLDRALADGDRIQAVVRGLGMSSDGRGRSLWAPRKEGQVEAMRRAYASGLDPTRVQYMEAHATSTQVGDATEVEALREYFSGVAFERKIPIGSVKSNIGHTLETAGLAGLVKSVLAMQHGVIPPSINIRRLNRTIPWDDLPFFVARESSPWRRANEETPRRAAVNAFGIGGLNVHVVVDEYDPAWDYHRDQRLNPRDARPAPYVVQEEPIAVIGRGIVLPDAFHIKSLAGLLASSAAHFREPPNDRIRHGVLGASRAGYVEGYEYDWRKFKIPPKQLAQANPLQFMLLDAARQALEEAGYDQKAFDRTRSAVIVGSAFSNEFGNQLQVGLRLPETRAELMKSLLAHGIARSQAETLLDQFETILLDAKPALLDETGSFTASTLASRVSKTLDLMGGAMAIDSGDCSASAALESACGLLRAGACSTILCAGASRSLDIPSMELLAHRGRLPETSEPSNRFTGKSTPGEGVAMVLLKRLADAERDGDRVLGIVRRVGATNLAVSARPVAPLASDPIADRIGHTQSAHGLVSLVAAVEASPGEATLRSVTHTGLEYRIDFVVGSELPATKPIVVETRSIAVKPTETPVNRTAPNFVPSSVNAADFRLIRIGAADEMELADKLRAARNNIAATWNDSHRFTTSDVCRLCLVASDEKALSTKLDLALQRISHPAMRSAAEEQGVYVDRLNGNVRRVAFLFPGQGSQYPNMLHDLPELSPAAAAVMTEADAWLAEHDGESFETLAWGDGSRLGHDIWATQATMLLADWMMLAALTERGMKADVVTGHSFGEFAALAAAGCWSLDQALRVTRVRADAINASRSGHGGLMSIDSAAARVAGLIAQHGCSVYITHYNGPQQTVVGGDDRSLAEFAALLQAEGLNSRPLSVPSAFHTPLLADTQKPLGRALATEALHPPRIPLLSSVTNRYTAEPVDLRGNLTAQMIEPVRFVQLIERLYDDGIRVFVEVGPQQVLTRLSRQILADRDVLLLPTDHPKRSAAEMLLRLQAALEAADVFQSPQEKPLDVATKKIGATESHAIETFDATARRRERHRHAAPVRLEVRRESSAPLERFDATTQRRDTRRAAAERVAPVETVVAKPEPAVVAAKANPSLERFLVDFVVEQTGYPAEMIDLDWDMEADLGIDSIKRAQLFGELREFFDFSAASSGTSLDRFRTLRQVLTFLQDLPGKGVWLKTESANVPRVEPRVEDGAPHKKNGHAVPVAKAEPVATPVPSAPASGEAESFLVNFVVEQTGYPPEIVELDADLEADLGIDSIKKAQLFGELRDHFRLPVEKFGRVKLSDFRTLRQVLAVISEHLPHNAPKAGSPKNDVPPDAPNNIEPPTTSPDYDRGLARGRQESDRVHSWLRDRADATWSETKSSVAIAGETEFSPKAWEEMRGMADGAGLHIGNVAAYERSRSALPAAIKVPQIPLPSKIASRYVLRTVAAAPPKNSPTQPKWHGAAVIVGDNEVGEAIRARFERDGRRAHVIVPTDDPETAVAELDRLWQREPVCHLFFVTPRDAAAATSLDARAWQKRRAQGLMTPYRVCQRWMKLVLDAGLMEQATLTATTSLGGDFGFSGEVRSAESGAMSGLLKAIFIESWVSGFRSTPMKVIDAPADEPRESIVEAVWREVAAASFNVEVAVRGGERRVIRAYPQPSVAVEETPIRRGAVWVCTGGARGITAFVAKEFAKRYGVKLHLLGTMPEPKIPASWRDLSDDGLKSLKLEVLQQARATGKNAMKHWLDTEKLLEIDRTLRELSAEGIEVAYHSCDVGDRDALAEVLERIRATDGPIEGVLHGAGFGKDARFEHKDPEKVEQCFRAKIDGTINLMDLTRRDPLRHFIGFGSISGRFGANGHADYSPANDMLSKLVDWYRKQRPEVKSITFHWHAWDDFGMATRPDARLGLELVNMQFMPAAEGLAHLLRELQGGVPEREVLVTDDYYYRLFYPAEALGGEAESERKFPLLDDGRSERRDDEQTVTLELDPLSEIFLTDHRLEDRPLLPVVVGMEMLAEAASKLAALNPTSSGRAVSLHDVQAVNGLRFFSDRAQAIRISAKPLDASRYACEVTADFHARDGRLVEPNRAYLRGRIEVADAVSPPTRTMPRVDEAGWQTVEFAPAGGRFYLGPPLRALKRIGTAEGVLWGRIFPPMLQELAGRRRSSEGWIVPSAALDACLYAVGLLAWSQVQPGASLPFRFGRIVLGRLPKPGEECLVEARYRGREGRYADFDFTLFGANGETILDVVDYRIVWLS